MSTDKESKMSLRKCANIKSRRQPDQKCSEEAKYGEFCSKHIKRPIRFPLLKNYDPSLTRTNMDMLVRLQRKFRFRNGLRRSRQQGPAATFLELSDNETEVSTLEALSTIPILYRFSFADSQKHIYTFDIRTLYQLIERSGYTITNPYNRELIGKTVVDKLIERINFLRKRKFCLLIVSDIDLTDEQLIHQRVVDVCLKYDFLGFYTSPEWFENLDLRCLKEIYINLYNMFILRPVADSATLDSIYKRRSEDLFDLRIHGINNRKDKKVLQTAILNAFEKLVTTSPKKENRCLGATYSLKIWAMSYPQIYINYPWLV